MSAESARAEPGRTLSFSPDAGWTSLLLQTVESPGTVEPFQTTATPDHVIVLVLAGQYTIESVSSRSSNKVLYRPGSGGMTAPMNTSRLRWTSSSHRWLRSLHLYLPHRFLEESALEYERVGIKTTSALPDLLGFEDPAITAVLRSLLTASEAGAPDFHAEAAARFLASHLLLGTPVLDRAAAQHRGTWVDSRLQRALDFLHASFLQPVTLERLAREAAISPFHFSRVFKQKLGISPARYMVRLRMKHAAVLLQTTDLSVAEVALAVGYAHAGRFAMVFQREHGILPSRLRASH